MELGCLWWTNVLNSALPPQRHRPDTSLEHEDPVSHTAQKRREGERKKERKRERKKERKERERKKERKKRKLFKKIIKNKKLKSNKRKKERREHPNQKTNPPMITSVTNYTKKKIKIGQTEP